MVSLLAPDETSLAFIAVNMRQSDRDEIYNAIGHNNPFLLARAALDASRVGSAVVACSGGQPVAVMGHSPLRPGVSTAFAFSTAAFPRVALSLTRYALRVMRPDLIAGGCHRLECQSRIDHVSAHRWLEAMGFQREGILHKFGSDGSDYLMYGATV